MAASFFGHFVKKVTQTLHFISSGYLPFTIIFIIHKCETLHLLYAQNVEHII